MRDERRILETLIATAQLQIAEEQPFFFNLMKRIPKILRPDLSGICALGFDQMTHQISILLNPEKLYLAHPEEIKIILEHLLMHSIFAQQHLRRMQNGHLYHLACDVLINYHISSFWTLARAARSRVPEFRNLLNPEVLRPLLVSHGLDLRNTAVDELYQIFQSDSKIDFSKYSTLDEDEFQIQNLLSFPKLIKEDLNQSGTTAKNFKTSFTSLIINAVTETQKQNLFPGMLPGFLKDQITTVLKESRIDYSTVLRSFVSSVTNQEKLKTWSRPHRKYPGMIKGRINRSSEQYRILVGLDTSASMWTNDIKEILMSELSKIHRTCPDLWIVGGDIAERFRYHLKARKFEPQNLILSGGGGTDLQFCFNAAKELKINGLVILTDGHVAPFLSRDIPTLFMIVPGGIFVEGYQNVALI